MSTINFLKLCKKLSVHDIEGLLKIARPEVKQELIEQFGEDNLAQNIKNSFNDER